MFKWGKRDSKSSSYEPKTPKLSSVALPDGRFTPVTTLKSPPNNKPISNLLFRHFTPDRRNTSALERRKTPLDTSRVRTISSPSPHLPAPRPIRPHPSQGPFVPILNDHEVYMNPGRTPLSVPSAQYLEAQIRRLPPDALKPARFIAQKLHDTEYEYPEEKRMKDVAAKNQDAEIRRGYREVPDAENPKTRSMNGMSNGILSSNTSFKRGIPTATSKRNTVPVEFNDWKPVPVMPDGPLSETVANDRRPILKSAMKKTPSMSAPPKSAMRQDPVWPTDPSENMEHAKAYYSEGESSRKKPWERTKLRVIQTPSKAWLEVQEEKREEERLRALGLRVRGPPGVPVYGRNAFPPTNSTTPSPVDTVHAPQDYHRARRASEPRPVVNSNYTQPYIRPGSEEYRMWKICDDFSKGIVHSTLAWPLIDFATRRREPMPLICFDAGFNPRIKKYAVKAKRGPVMTPLTREEETMRIAPMECIHHITIINRKLDRWPIHIHLPYRIRVIDVFRAIYDMYAQPLTPQEIDAIGPEAIARCGRAWKQRCEDGPDFTHNEEKKGLLRIDLLRGRRIFKGLIPIPGQSDTYELLFDEGR